MTPTRNNILIDIHVFETKSKVQFMEPEQTEKATVIACGPDVVFVKPGDVIFYKRYAIDEFKDEYKTYYLIEETEIKLLSRGGNDDIEY